MIYFKTIIFHLIAIVISINLQPQGAVAQPVPVPVAPVPTVTTTPIAPVPVPAPIPVNPPFRKDCGLFGLNIFCPFTFCGIFDRLLGICKDSPSMSPVSLPVQTPIQSPSPAPIQIPVRNPAFSPESPTIPITKPITRPSTTPTRLPPINNRYDITIDFDETSVPTMDYNDYISAAKRWEEIIIGDLDDVPASEIPTYEKPIAPGCSYPTGFIDDMYICVSYKQLSNGTGIIGQGTYTYIRSSNYLPVLGYIEIDPNSIDSGREFGYFNDVILHEIGHAIGLGTIANKCPTMNAFSKASWEYQQISQCNTSVPMQHPSCGHFSESCLTTELMTPTVTYGDSPISRITIGWLEDIGYGVNYTRADPFNSSQLGTVAGCNCNHQRQYQRSLWNNNNTNNHGTMKQQERSTMRLSVEGYNIAVAYGMEYLQEKRIEYNKLMMDKSTTSSLTSSSLVTYVGDQFVWIYMLENDQIHSVLIQQQP